MMKNYIGHTYCIFVVRHASSAIIRTSDQVKPSYDVLIVGGGHNGLVSVRIFTILL